VLFKVVRDVAVMRVSVKRHPEAQMAFINQAAQLVQNHVAGGQDIVFGTQLRLAIHTPNTKLFSDKWPIGTDELRSGIAVRDAIDQDMTGLVSLEFGAERKL
jgi:hypothetical protein